LRGAASSSWRPTRIGHDRKLRHPGALVRLIDAERANGQFDPAPYDTVFGYEDPEPFDYEVRPRRRNNSSFE